MQEGQKRNSSPWPNSEFDGSGEPCGVIASVSELFVQLLQLQRNTSNFSYLGYDRPCEFEPFLNNLAKKGNGGTKLLLERKYVLNRFHIKGHTTPACDF